MDAQSRELVTKFATNLHAWVYRRSGPAALHTLKQRRPSAGCQPLDQPSADTIVIKIYQITALILLDSDAVPFHTASFYPVPETSCHRNLARRFYLLFEIPIEIPISPRNSTLAMHYNNGAPWL